MKVLKATNTLALAILLSIGGYNSSATATEICGAIFDDTTWTLAESPYLVTCDVVLFPERTLIIEPGVSINFEPSTQLTIRGTLNAIGTEDKRIVFTSVSPLNNWSGVRLATNLGGKAVIEYADFSYASTAISVECCWGVDEPANISNSTFRNNGTALGGYAGNDVIVRSSIFENNDTAIASADKEIYNSAFRNNGYGIRDGGRSKIILSIFDGNDVGIHTGDDEIIYTDIINNDIGIDNWWGAIKLSRSNVTGNTIGIIFNGHAQTVEYNNIFGNTTYNAKVVGAVNRVAPNNWWGTTATAEIDAKIYDGQDNPALGLLEFFPFLTEPILEVAANLSVTKTDSPDPIIVGENLTYTLVVVNDGPDESTGVLLTDNLPDNVEFVSATPTQGSCGGTSIITCDLGTLSEGADVAVTIVVTPTIGGEISNKANVAGTEPDPNPSDNIATETTVVKSGGPGVSVTGISPTKIKGACYNMTTRQMIRFPLTPDATSWNCEEEGLVVNTGDQIKIKIKVEGTGD